MTTKITMPIDSLEIRSFILFFREFLSFGFLIRLFDTEVVLFVFFSIVLSMSLILFFSKGPLLNVSFRFLVSIL